MYKWKDGFAKGNKLPESFVKKIFDILNKGTMYIDVNGKFVGYINAVEGPLGIVHLISDHSLDSDDYKFVIIKAIYLDRKVLYFRVGDDSLTVDTFMNGHWTNSVQRTEV